MRIVMASSPSAAFVVLAFVASWRSETDGAFCARVSCL